MNNWFIRVTADTHDWSGKRRRFSRLIPKLPVLSNEAIKQWIENNLPALFHGCDVHVVTPLHHDRGIVDPDTHKFVYSSIREQVS